MRSDVLCVLSAVSPIPALLQAQAGPLLYEFPASGGAACLPSPVAQEDFRCPCRMTALMPARCPSSWAGNPRLPVAAVGLRPAFRPRPGRRGPGAWRCFSCRRGFPPGVEVHPGSPPRGPAVPGAPRGDGARPAGLPGPRVVQLRPHGGGETRGFTRWAGRPPGGVRRDVRPGSLDGSCHSDPPAGRGWFLPAVPFLPAALRFPLRGGPAPGDAGQDHSCPGGQRLKAALTSRASSGPISFPARVGTHRRSSVRASSLFR